MGAIDDDHNVRRGCVRINYLCLPDPILIHMIEQPFYRFDRFLVA